jgi:hypothetical protein
MSTTTTLTSMTRRPGGNQSPAAKHAHAAAVTRSPAS